MPRRLRVQLPGLVRHVVSRGNGKMEVFLDDTDYRHFIDVLGTTIEMFDVECWNYCVMPNHYHATLCPRQPNISLAMKHLNSVYAQWWNKRHSRVGHTFQGRFKDQIIQDDAYLLAVCRYVALNPVRAGLASRPEDWPWSSYAGIVGLRHAPPFVLADQTLRLFGDSGADVQRARFAEFVTQGDLAGALDERIRSSEWVIGDAAFKRQIASGDEPRELTGVAVGDGSLQAASRIGAAVA